MYYGKQMSVYAFNMRYFVRAIRAASNQMRSAYREFKSYLAYCINKCFFDGNSEFVCLYETQQLQVTVDFSGCQCLKNKMRQMAPISLSSCRFEKIRFCLGKQKRVHPDGSLPKIDT